MKYLTYLLKNIQMHHDPYTYPDTNVFINKFNIRDGKQLENLEMISLYKAVEKGIPLGNFSLSHLQNIHKKIFADIYDWAGKIRTVDIQKEGAHFCSREFIEIEFDKLSNQLKSERYLTNIDQKDTFVEKFSHYYAEVNAIHPFRDGNGRTTRVFFEQLARINEYKLDFNSVSKEELLNATKYSFHSNNSLLENIFKASLSMNDTVKQINKSFEYGR